MTSRTYVRPWTVHGLDLLDRAGVDALEFGSPDPFAQDTAEDAEGNEILTRETGESGSLSSLSFVKEMIDGNPPRKRPRDMTPHNICSFSLTVIHRICLKQSDVAENPLFEKACSRMIALTLDQEGSFSGGEFVGYALTAAAGIGKHGIPPSMGNWNVFKTLPGSSGALAVELFQSGDSTGGIEERLGAITPAEWSQKSADEVQHVLQNWILRKLDGMGGLHDNPCSAIPAVLANMLEGHPVLTKCLETPASLSPRNIEEQRNMADIGWAIAIMESREKFGPLLCGSSFGVFVRKHYEERHQTKAAKLSASKTATTADATAATTTRMVIKSLVRRWDALSHSERAGYVGRKSPLATKNLLEVTDGLRRPP